MKKNNQRGFILILTVLILTTLLMSGSYLVAVSTSENKIAHVQSLATKNYYLAEAGINDMIWKIQNDSATGQAFLDGTLSSVNDISRTNIFGDSNAGYQVAARNTVSQEAWITSTSTYQIGNFTSQRVVKSYITQASGSGAEWNFSTFAGGRGAQQNGNFRFNGSGDIMTSNDGRLHANQEFKIQGGKLIVNNGAVTSANVINVVAGGELDISNNSYQNAPTTTIDMLQIDFDEWQTRADVIYSKENFEDLASGTILNGIIYVTGDANIIGKNLIINGVLVAEGDINITISGTTVDINVDATDGGGLLSKEDITIVSSGGTLEVDGLIYASDDLDITNSGATITINGSMGGFDAEVTRSGGTITLNYVLENFEAVIDGSVNPSSPIIQIDHWEEQY